MFEPEKLDDLLNNAPALRRVLEELDRIKSESKHVAQEKELTWQMAMQYKEQNIAFREQVQHLEHDVRQIKLAHDQEVKKLKQAFDSERQALSEHLQDLQSRAAKQEQELTYFRRLPDGPSSREHAAKLEAELAETKRQLAQLQTQGDSQLDQRFREKRQALELEIQERFMERIRTLEEHWKFEQQERGRQAQAAGVLQQELYARLTQVEDTLNQERLLRQEADRQRIALQHQTDQWVTERQGLVLRAEGATRDVEAFRRERDRLQGDLAQRLQLEGPARDALEQRAREAETERQAIALRAEGMAREVELIRRERDRLQGDLAQRLQLEGPAREALEQRVKEAEAELARERIRRQTAETQFSQVKQAAAERTTQADQWSDQIRQSKEMLDQREIELSAMRRDLTKERLDRERLTKQLEETLKQLEQIQSQNQTMSQQLLGTVGRAAAGVSDDVRQTWPIAMKSFLSHTEQALQETIQKLSVHYQQRERELAQQMEQLAAQAQLQAEDTKKSHAEEIAQVTGRTRDEVSKLREERRRVDDQLSQARRDVDAVRGELDRTVTQARDDRRQIEDQLRETERTLSQTQKDLSAQISSLQQSLTHQIESTQRAQVSHPSLQTELAEEKARVRDMQERLTQASAARDSISKMFEDAQSQISRLKLELQESTFARRLAAGAGEGQEDLIKQLHEADIRVSEMQDRIRHKDQEVMELLSRLQSVPTPEMIEGTSKETPEKSGNLPEPARQKVTWQEPARSQAQGGLLVSELVFGIAHQLRNPLGIIRANVQYCLKTLKLKPREKDQLTMVIRNIEQITQRIQEFVDFTRPMRFAFAPIRPAPILEEALTLVKTRCQEQKIKLESNAALGPALPSVSGDPEKIKQVFLNLLVNAVESMPGGGTLKASIASDAQAVTVTIHDTGRGVKKEHQPQLMVPFFTTKEGGLGLGLAYSKQIIAAHHGSLEVTSPGEGQGATVTIKLPVVAAGLATPASSQAGLAKPASPAGA